MEFIKAVRDHARNTYDEDGWDIVWECWDDDMILEIIADAQTAEEAIALVREIAVAQDDYRKDIQATAW